MFLNFLLIKKAEFGYSDIHVVKDLPGELIAALASPVAVIIPEVKTFVVASYPKILPKLVGVEILEGNIFSE